MSDFSNAKYSVTNSLFNIQTIADAFETIGNYSLAENLREIMYVINAKVNVMDDEYQAAMDGRLREAMQGTANMLSMAMAMDKLNDKVTK